MTPPIPTEDSDRPGDAVSIEHANRIASASWWSGLLAGLVIGWLTALAAAALGWWWSG